MQGTMTEMCEEADLIMEQANQTAEVSAIAAAARANLQAQDERQDLEVDSVGRGRRKFRPKLSGGPAQEGKKSFVCNPHTKIGSKAFSCRERCTFSYLPLVARPTSGNSIAGR